MSKEAFIAYCPKCGDFAEVDTSVQYMSYPAKYDAQCFNKECLNNFMVYETEIRKKTGWEVRGRSVNKTSEVHRAIGAQAMSMKPDEIIINKGNYIIKRRLPENIESILEKYEAFEEIIKQINNGEESDIPEDKKYIDLEENPNDYRENGIYTMMISKEGHHGNSLQRLGVF